MTTHATVCVTKALIQSHLVDSWSGQRHTKEGHRGELWKDIVSVHQRQKKSPAGPLMPQLPGWRVSAPVVYTLCDVCYSVRVDAYTTAMESQGIHSGLKSPKNNCADQTVPPVITNGVQALVSLSWQQTPASCPQGNMCPEIALAEGSQYFTPLFLAMAIICHTHTHQAPSEVFVPSVPCL